MEKCFHCGLPAKDDFSLALNGKQQNFCCLGCQAVAQAITQGGLSDFYRFRDQSSRKVNEAKLDFSQFDLAGVQEDFVNVVDENHSECIFSVEGITCAACAWLIENHLKRLESIADVRVNASNYTAKITWNKSKGLLSEIFNAFYDIGFRAYPYIESQRKALKKREREKMLMRIGVAGLGMMQVGMFAIVLHAGDIQGIESHWESFFRWVSLLVATPIVMFSAGPFFFSAKVALKARQLNMDVPVALAISLAYLASAFATFRQVGEVYFDSIAMFTFFLLLGRYFELRARHSRAFSVEEFTHLFPLSVEKLTGATSQMVPYKTLEAGDQIYVSAGAMIPCDAKLLSETACVDETVLNGESTPQTRRCNDLLWAGSYNGDTPILIEVVALKNNTRLASIERLTHEALMNKPKQLALVDKIASVFVFFVLCAAALSALAWYFIDPNKSLWIALSVLVVSCPCALSLATPVAITAGTLRMKKLGLLVTAGSFIEKLRSVDTIIFDKTGTLTRGELSIEKVETLDSLNQEEVLALISALEKNSHHPIANAFKNIQTHYRADKMKTHAGLGVEASIDGINYRFGLPHFVLGAVGLGSDLGAELGGKLEAVKETFPGEGLWQLFGAQGRPLAWVLFSDSLRDSSFKAVNQLRALGKELQILSGDRLANVLPVAEKLGIESFYGGQSPEDKLYHLERLRNQGKNILMVGDGLNDIPGLSGAFASIAMNSASEFAQSKADAILLSDNLQVLPSALALSVKVNAKVKQNLTWALIYNITVLPAAMCGFVPPYLAAIGMSLSSLVVVLNALRLQSYTPSILKT